MRLSRTGSNGRFAAMTPGAFLSPGAVVDGFVLREKRHRGGMANIWSATRPDIDRPVVLKIPVILDGDDATAIVGFEMEQMILPLLSGPHAPRCHGVGDFADQPYIAMEDVEGESLLGLIDRAPLPVEELRELGAKIALALDDLHRQHVLHLDIKPSNVMRRKGTGEIVLIDFGLSHHLKLPDLLGEEFRLPMGTGPYISPEQVDGRRDDPRSDLFALGVMLYYLATGARPFGFPRNRAGLRRRLWSDPVPPRALRPDLPKWFQEIVLRCLEGDPAARHPTAAQLAFDLQNPDQVRITARGERLKRAPLRVRLRRWWRAHTREASRAPPPGEAFVAAPIVVAAVDLSENEEELREALRATVGRVLRAAPGVRLACVNILRQNRLTANYALDEQGRNIHVQRLVELKIWARPLGDLAEAATFHVLEAVDPATALIDYARANNVDQVVIGARGASSMRRYLGSVSAAVAASAPCTVTIVRAPSREGRAGSGEEDGESGGESGEKDAAS